MTKEKVEKLMKEKKNYAPSKLYKDISHDETCRDLYSGCMHLLKLSLMSPLSVVCSVLMFIFQDEAYKDSFKKLAR